MDKSKVDFISDLLAHKHISVTEKERLFLLTKDEIQKLGEADDERLKNLLERIEKLEKEERDENKEKSFLMYHKPKEITGYLNKFRENSVLKWTTHVWDESKYLSITEFIDALNTNKDHNKIFKYNRDLYNLINYFLYKPPIVIEDGAPKYGFPNYNAIKIGWQYPDNILINWCKENFDNKGEDKKYPFEFVLPKKLQPQNPVKGKMITTFENIVDVFKTEIQFRDDYFYKELKKRNNRMVDYTFEGIEYFENLNFYTYTSGVLSAIDTILNEIKKNETEKRITLKYEIKDAELIIDITHENSYPTRSLNTYNLSQFLGGGLNAISGSLFSLCDFSMISKFKDENQNSFNGELCINYEGTEGEIKKREIMYTTPPILKKYNAVVTGFTYRLIFYL